MATWIASRPMTWPKPQPPSITASVIGFVHDGDVLTGDDIARFQPLYIFGDAQHAVGVVSGQVGLNQVFGHECRPHPVPRRRRRKRPGRWRSVGAEKIWARLCLHFISRAWTMIRKGAGSSRSSRRLAILRNQNPSDRASKWSASASSRRGLADFGAGQMCCFQVAGSDHDRVVCKQGERAVTFRGARMKLDSGKPGATSI